MLVSPNSQYPEPTFPIFISYRRADALNEAFCLFYGLSAHFGKDAVFMDVNSLGPGDLWRGEIPRAAYACRVMLVVIGPQWLTVTESNSSLRRLDNPYDLHRAEIAAALARGIRVVPVLVDGASLPRPQDLPEDLRPLLNRQAYRITHDHWFRDIGELATRLERDVRPGNARVAAGAGVIQAAYAVPAAGAVTIMFSANLEVRDVVIVVAEVALVAVVLALLVYLCYRSGGLQGT